ncbi:MAG TPA: non-ribosomal peptide synthase/polyketide synthase, partial [Thermoanaerobaculia bacterium]
MPMAYRLRGRLEPGALAAALSEIVRRHEALRTRFANGANGPVQVIEPAVALSLPRVDLDALPETSRRREEERLLAAEALSPFDLSRGPLFRALLLCSQEGEWTLLLAMHHIVSDAWSMGVLLHDLEALYGAALAGRPSPLPELSVQYADFAAWQREWLQGEVLERQLAYWREQLAGHPPVLELPTDRPRPAVQTFRGAAEPVILGVRLSEGLKALSRQRGEPLFMTMLAGFLALLHRSTGQTDLLVGTPSAGRNRAELEGLIGFFINTLVLRTDAGGDPAFAELIGRARETALGAYAHGDLPLDRIVEELAPERSLSYSPLFQVLFVLQTAPGELPRLPGVEVEPLPLPGDTAKFDLTLSLAETTEGLAGDLEYDRGLFDAATVRRMVGHLRILLAGAVADLAVRLSALPLLSPAERGELLLEWNDRARAYPRAPLVHELFAAHARRRPEAVAVAMDGRRLTYGELEARGNRLAHHLRSLGVGPDVVVGVCAERTLERVVGIVAALKAGGAYASFDPAHPRERLAVAMADARTPVLLTESRWLDRVPESAATVICLDRDLEEMAGEESRPPAVEVAPENLAYVIFTSGSTGRPKGVAIPHQGLLNLVHWHHEAYGVTPEDVGTQVASPAFDMSVWELWPLLAAGASTSIPDEETRLSPARMLRWWAREGVTLAFLPTPLGEGILGEEIPPDLALELRCLVVAGDRLHRAPSPELPFRVSNIYGPAEHSMATTMAIVPPAVRDAADARVPTIGRGLGNTRIYVLDAWQQPVAVGVPGELYVSGIGLARGYIWRPELTAERFLPDPFGGEPDARMYRSGDLVRWLPDGDLDFLGRIDHQVKIRGMRVELGEIEAVLGRHPGVLEAVALVREDRPGDKRLTAYVAGGGKAAPSVEELRGFLDRELPSYMVPQNWVFLDALPLTPNGKLDRRALPAPERPVEAAAVTPRTPLEDLLAAVFCQVFGLQRVSVDDNFFALGGHSLLATQVAARVRRVLGIELEIRTLFEAPTVEGLARRIEAMRYRAPGAAAPPLRPVPRGDDPRLPLSFAQARLWFLDQLEPGSLYNIPVMFRVEGRIDVAAMAGALAEIVRRHEALRTHFGKAGDEPVQVIAPAEMDLGVVLPLIDLSALPAGPRAQESGRLALEEATRPFDLSRGPLARFALVSLAVDEHALFLSLHHIVSDGWSMGVLTRELGTLYAGLTAGAPPRLPELPVQYADYAVWQRGWLRGEALAREVDYWRGKLGSSPAVLDLPTDRLRPAVQSFRGGAVSRRLPRDLAGRIDSAARELGGTPFILLMAAFQALLGRYIDASDINVGTPIAGRTRVETEGLIGFFVNTLVLRTSLAANPSFAGLVDRVRDSALEAYAHQNLPFEKLVEALEPERSLSHSPLFQVMFVLNNGLFSLDMPGLRLKPFLPALGTAKFDLLLAMGDQGEGMDAVLEYSADLFDAPTAARMLGQLEMLLDKALSDPRQRLWDIPLLTEGARAQLLVEWNDNAAPVAPLTQSERFAAMARRVPGQVALTFRGEDLTYAEVDARANRLANLLRRLGVGPGVAVGVCLERSLAMPVAMLAIFKAGGVFLPLDPAYPEDRLAFMLADAEAPVLLTEETLLGLLPDFTGIRLILESLGSDLEREAADPLSAGVDLEDLAYVIYTSGSTGRPKGIAMTHRALANLVAFHLGRATGAEARTLQFSPLSFDVCFQEMFSTWAVGGTVVLISDDDRRNPEALLEILESERIGRLFLPFVALNHLAEAAERLQARPSRLREVITAGEQLQSSDAIVGWFRRLGDCTLENQYGPSELHVVTAFPLPCDPGDWMPLPPVGRSVLNLRLYILDASQQPVPIGVAGEIFLGGPQMARGYLRRPDLTAERFVPDHLGGEPGQRLYRSGDLARYLAGGNVEFLGRVDLQVKVRGFRIELGEIEAVLVGHPGVREAAVLAREDGTGGKRLVAYVAPAVPEEELRELVKAKLPAYMAPAAFVGLDALPVASTGKVDRRALAAIEVTLGPTEGYVAPRTAVEELLAGIWAELLGRDQVGIRDDFFHLGGHSLLATQVLSRVRRLLGVQLSIRTLFESSTVEALAHQVERAREEADRAAGWALAPAARDRALPLSFAQARLWFLDRLQPGSSVYNIPLAYRLRGRLRPAALAAALSEIVRRHEALRTHFAEEAEGPVQVIEPAGARALPQVDLGGLPEPARRDEEVRLTGEEALRPFGLERGPLLRTLLVRLAEDEWVLVLAMHHIVSDGWSMGVMLRELEALYGVALAGLPSPLPELPVQYADFAVWQREWLRGEELGGQLAYWRERLAGHPPVLELPTDRPRPAMPTFHGGDAPWSLGPETSERLRDLSRRSGAPLFMTLLSGFLALLHRYTGQDDLLVGTPLAGRNRVELEGLIGFFVNTLVLRTGVEGDPSFQELLGRVRETALGAYAHGDLPFERLVEELSPERTLGLSPLFQVTFALQTEPVGLLRVPGLEVAALELSLAVAKFDLAVAMAETAAGLEGAVAYNRDLFDAATARRMGRHLEILMAGAAAHPEARLSELPLLSAAERDELLLEWNDTAAAADPGLRLHHLFEVQAARTPEALAVLADGGALTYAELDARADRLARHLRDLGVGAEIRVGLCLERCLEMVVSLLAVLKAGGAYVPLDPEYPAERLAVMFADGGIQVVLTQQRLLPVLPEPRPFPVLCVDAEWPSTEQLPEAGAALQADGSELAYALFTSGSTGRPKGVAIPQRAIVNHMLWMQSEFPLRPGDRVLQKTPFSFDASVWEFYAPLISGATLVMAKPGGHRDPGYLATAIQENGVTIFQAVPALLRAMLDDGRLGECGSLRRVFCGGEELTADIQRDVFAALDAELVNLYGPTETTIEICSWRCRREEVMRPALLGRPIANGRVHVLSPDGNLCPIGVPGEISIGGVPVGRGYLGRPDETAFRFVPDPFGGEAGGRLYLSGDLGRRLAGGALEFLGRIDHQVKVRGFRIELGEVEAVLASHPAVTAAAVLARGQQLSAYVTARREAAAVPAGDLRGFLRERLPDYMVPAAFVWLEALPLTPSGKVDRRALERIEVTAEPSTGYVAPRTWMEEALAYVWMELLGLDRVGVRDNFFHLGGHSLLATQVVSRVRRLLGITIEIRSLFEEPTIEGLARQIERSQEEADRATGLALVATARERALPLSFAQTRLWFLDRLQPGSSVYNLPLACRLRGRLKPGALVAALSEIVRRHEALRTRFLEEPEGPVQVIEPAGVFALPRADLGSVPEPARGNEAARLMAEEALRPFDLERGPLFRTLLVRVEEDEWALMLAMHHIVSDGWSMDVLLRELAVLYEAFAAGRPSPLPELPMQYADFAVWQRRWLSGETLSRQLDYWRHELAGAPSGLDLPTDFLRPAVQTFNGADRSAELPAELSAELKAFCQRQGVTLFMLLLAGLDVLLSRYSGQEDVLVGSPVANRNRAETEDLIGFFVNTLVLRARLGAALTFQDLLRQVREVALAAYDHQDLPFEKLVEELRPERDLSRSAFFQVMLLVQPLSRELPGASDLELSLLEGKFDVAKFDLSLTVMDEESALSTVVGYNTDLFEAVTAQRLLGHLGRLLEEIVINPERGWRDLPLLTEAEHEQLLGEFNDTGVPIGPGICLHHLFEAQAARTPEGLAVVAAEGALTYEQLDERANQLARYLIDLGVGAEVLVGLCLERSLEMVVGLLGVLKAGGAYVPLDPEYPAERLALMFADAAIQVVLTQQRLLPVLPLSAESRLLPALCLDTDWPSIEARSRELSGSAAELEADGLNLVYVLFTSGSTGRPKGVAIPQRAIVNHMLWMQSEFPLRPGDRVLQKTPFSFDASVWEFYAPLISGATLIMAKPGGHRDPGYLATAIQENGITIFQSVPALLRAMLDEGGLGDCRTLRRVFCGGEELTGDVQRDFFAAQAAELVNLYGPTETTIEICSWQRLPERSGRAALLGRPITNGRVHVLNPDGVLCPIGVPGEISIGGTPVGRGYLGRPEETAVRFVPDPFGGEPGGRLYRSGDLGRWAGEGALEFLGRIDHQVKVRGFRIELGEVESVLASHPAVAAAAVLARGQQLSAYVTVRREAASVPAEDLRGFLQGRLPDYMVPSGFVWLEVLPLTPNGKVDRRALERIEVTAEPSTGYVAPRTIMEEMLARVWTELLGLDRVGVRDNFFHLGGHSLLATQVASRVRRLLGIIIEIRSLFEEPTIEGLARRIEAERQQVPEAATPSLRPVPRGEGVRLPLSFAQARLWFLDQLEPGPLYNVPAMFRVEGRIDVAALAGAFTAILRRHEALRTRFGRMGDEPVQVIAPADTDFGVVLPLIDLSSLPGEPRSGESLRLAREEALRPFDLSLGPLVRSVLVRLVADEHALFLSLHHIVSDAWSMEILLRELGTLYAGFSSGNPSSLPELPVQYADFAVWQRQWLQGEVLERELGYWRGRLGGAPALLELPTDRPRPAVQSFRGGTVSRQVLPELAARIDSLSSELGGTPFILLMAVFQALLCRYANQSDINVGTPIAGRNRMETEGLIGFFVNTLVLRASLAGNPTFTEVVGRVREVALEAHSHQDVPFEKLVEALEPERSLSHTPLFQVMFVLLNTSSASTLPGLRLSSLLPDRGTAKFDLLLFVGSEDGEMASGIEYSTDLFDGTTAARMLEAFQTLLDGALADPERRLWDLPLLTEAARAQLLVEWNDTAAPVPGLTASERFEAQARRQPGEVALTFRGEDLTYAEADARANRLAHLLRRLGVGPGVPVGVCLERSLAVPVAVLAVLKAGGVFLPLDPAYPAERLAFMLADASAPVLLTQAELLGLWTGFAGTLLCLETLGDDLERQPGQAPAAGAGPLDPAYLIYTSGSTGWPKGVAMTHGALANLIEFHLGHVTGAEARTLQFTPLSFDVCFQEMFSTWAVGGTLVLISDEDRRDPEALLEILERERISRLFLPFVALHHLAEAGERRGARPSHLRRVITAGEQLRASDAIVGWFRRLESCALENHYGPSETHAATAFPLPLDPGCWTPLPPIGRPILNSRIYLLDPHLQPVPIGVPGEIFLGGAQVARGYLGRPELTAERFVPDPLGGRVGERLYRTGDLARYLADGNVEFLGRIDLQVKVRGFRIELGEIEAILTDYPGVRQAAVLAREDGSGGRRLVAYLAPAVPEEEIRDFLKTKLPDYMVPSAFVGLEVLPLTPTGKVDRRALAAIEVALGPTEGYVAPRTVVEKLLAGIWAELLGRDQVGIRDDFFHLGGHSLLATQVLSRVRRLLRVELSIRTLFESATVEALARQVERAREDADRAAGWALAPAVRDRELPLSFAQARLWFLDRLLPGSAVYNMPTAYRLHGRLEPGALEAVLNEIVRRHEVLRTRLSDGLNGPVQVIEPAGPSVLPQVDLNGLPEPDRRREEARLTVEEARRPFDLERGPLLRTLLLRMGEGEWVLMLAMHHVISDGWSIGVMLRELEALYGAALAGLASPLPELPMQYADFAIWQREWLRGEELERQLAYWRGRLAGHPPVLELPVDRQRPMLQTFRGAVAPLSLGLEVSGRLRDLSRRNGAPLFMTLLAGFLALLHRYTGQTDLLVGTPAAGRSRMELEGLIGFFINTLVLRTDVSGDPSFGELLERAREVALGAYAHGDLPLERLVEELAPERNLSHSPLFQVVFALQTGPVMALPRIAGLEAEALELPLAVAKFDLTVAMAEVTEDLAGVLEYNCDLFDAATARRMASHLQTLLTGAAAHPEARLSELPLLSAAERGELLEWNDTAREYPRASLVHELFAAHARRRPEALAVTSGDRRLTYGELESRSNRLAHHLRSLGVGPDVVVGICMERTLERVMGIVATLKAGGAYASFDPAYPPERLALLMEDARVPVLLTERRHLDRLPESAAAVTVCLGTDLDGLAGDESRPPAVELDLENLAYVIFTSGSMGRPKGVAVPHRGLLNLVHWHHETYGVTPDDLGTQVASPAFDASVWELWTPLTAGAGTAIPDDETRLSPTRMMRWWADEGVTLALLPTPLADGILNGGIPPDLTLRVRYLVVGGDRLHRFPRPGTPFLLSNIYGPAEHTTATTMALVPPAPRDTAEIRVPTIGRALANTRVHVLDAHLRPVPVGVPGELYVAGAGLARGYLWRPELTAERFLPDPFAALTGDCGARMYRTGDLVRRLPDGDLDFLGRIDHQVKLRGMRVELGEIESVLGRHPGVREAVVLVPEGRLTAYVVGVGEHQLSIDELRGFLDRQLPSYMVPQGWALLDALPLTPNGKVDRQALERIAVPSSAPEREYLAPRTVVEEALAGVWEELLGIDRVGVRDDFFRLGGHSLLATQVLSRVRLLFRVELGIRTLFEGPTVEAMGRWIDRIREEADRAAGLALAPAPRDRELPLSFSQQRLWFLDRLQPDSSVYNLPVAYRLRGRLEPSALAASLSEIARRHEALRTRFGEGTDGPTQVIDPAAPFVPPWVDLGGLPEPARADEESRLTAEEALRPFDLARGPLLRTLLLRLRESEWVLVLAMHHIVSDGWSMGVMLHELEVLYEAAITGARSPLPELPLQYADFAVWQREWLRGEELERQLAYWRERLAGHPPVLELPTDRPRPAMQTFRGAWEPLSLGLEASEWLGELSRRNGAPLFMTLLAGFLALLHRYTGQTDLLVGTPAAGRSRIELEGLIGFFINTLVLRTDASGDPAFVKLLGRTREMALGAYAHGDLPFERLVEELAPERNLSHSPLFQAMFVLQTGPMMELPRIADLEIEGLGLPLAVAKFDLTVAMSETAGGLEGAVEYNLDLFDAATARRMAGHLRTL